MRLRWSSRAIRDWSTPWARSSARSDRAGVAPSRARSRTRPPARGRERPRTAVIVTKPRPGSPSASTPSASTSRSTSFTLRIRSVGHRLAPSHRQVALDREHGAGRVDQVVLLRAQVALGVDEGLLDGVVLAAHDRHRQARALPAVVVVDLGHRRAEAPLELRLGVQQVLALALERSAVRQMQFEAQDAHETGRHGRTHAIGGCAR